MNWPRHWPKADPTSPYFCHGPTLISFSGGRTSAYMLYMVLCAHGGVLPDHVFVVFANTGKEREETLRFVHECSVRWGIHILWLERSEKDNAGVDPAERFNIVGYNSASRKGEPFKALIRKKGYLPNAVTRFCTTELKIRPMKHYMLSRGYETWTNMIGLRADERKRVMKTVIHNADRKERWISYAPLAVAGVVKRYVMRFWLGRNKDPRHPIYPLPQGFDLGLRDYEGNCDDCMLKGLLVLMHQERERPGTADWWSEREHEVSETAKGGAARFVTEYSYAQVKEWAQSTPPLDDFESLPAVGDCTAGECAVGSEEPDPDDETMAWLVAYMQRLWRDGPPKLTPAMKAEAAIRDLFGDPA